MADSRQSGGRVASYRVCRGEFRGGHLLGLAPFLHLRAVRPGFVELPHSHRRSGHSPVCRVRFWEDWRPTGRRVGRGGDGSGAECRTDRGRAVRVPDGMVESVPVLIAALIGAGICKGVYDSNIFASLFDVIRPEDRGTAAGLMNTVGWTAASAAPTVVGIASERFGLGVTIASTAAVYLLAGLLALLAARIGGIRAVRCDLNPYPCLRETSHGEFIASVRKQNDGAGYVWARRGDINAFFGLMLDNIGVMILMASLLVLVFRNAPVVRSDPDDPRDGRGGFGRRPDLYLHGVSARPADRPDRRHRDAAGPRHAEHVWHRLSDHRSSLSGSPPAGP